jgi:hypothetical protein
MKERVPGLRLRVSGFKFEALNELLTEEGYG